MGTEHDDGIKERLSRLKAILDRFRRMAKAAWRSIGESRQFEERQARLAAIVKYSADAMISTAMDGTIATWNHGAEMLYGHNAGDAIGKNISLVMPSCRQLEAGRLIEAIKSGKTLESMIRST